MSQLLPAAEDSLLSVRSFLLATSAPNDPQYPKLSSATGSMLSTAHSALIVMAVSHSALPTLTTHSALPTVLDLTLLSLL